MFIPKFIITNSVLKNIGQIDAGKEVIENASLSRGWEIKISKEARAIETYNTIKLEGLATDFETISSILDGQEVEEEKSIIQQVINCQSVYQFIDSIVEKIGPGKNYSLTIETILELHRLALEGLVEKSILGAWRSKQVAIKNGQTGEVVYTPPPALEIPYLIEDLVNWINSDEGRDFHPVVKSAIVLFELSRIHPFTIATGLVARALSGLLLSLDGYSFRRTVALEEYLEQYSLDYFTIIQSVSSQKVLDTHQRDLTAWLDFYCRGLAEQATKSKEKVKRIAKDTHAKDKLGEQVDLNERQLMIMEFLHKHKQMQNRDFRKIFPDHSDDTVLRELKFLKQKGLVKKEGGTKNAIYQLNN